MSRKCPSKACICSALTVWLFIAVCVLIVTSVLHLSPFLKVLRYSSTVCRIESSFYRTQYVCPCPAQAQCPSYPCYLVQVSLNYTDGLTWVVNLFVNDEQQAAVIQASSDQQERCTLRACDGDHLKNREVVDKFQRSYSYGQLVPCYYDPWDIKSGAVLDAKLPSWKVFHSVFWPSLCVSLGLTGCALFCRRCRRQAAAPSSSPSTLFPSGEEDEEKGVGGPGGLDQHHSPGPGGGGGGGGGGKGKGVEGGVGGVAGKTGPLARKHKHKKSLRNLWMVPRDV